MLLGMTSGYSKSSSRIGQIDIEKFFVNNEEMSSDGAQCSSLFFLVVQCECALMCVAVR